jgi:hypothetical protein
MATSWYVLRREYNGNQERMGGALHQVRMVDEIWLVPTDDPNTVAEAAAKMRDHDLVRAGTMRVRCEELTWQVDA